MDASHQGQLPNHSGGVKRGFGDIVSEDSASEDDDRASSWRGQLCENGAPRFHWQRYPWLKDIVENSGIRTTRETADFNALLNRINSLQKDHGKPWITKQALKGRIMRLKYTGTGASRGTSALRQPSSSSTPEELTPERTLDGETPQELHDNILERLDGMEVQWAAQLQDIRAAVSRLKELYEAELKRAAERDELKNAEIETLKNKLPGYQNKG